MLDIINEVDSKKAELEPDHAPYNPPGVMDIFKLLPKRAGCKRCGYETCTAFAAALSRGEAVPDDCPVLCEEEFHNARQKLAGLLC